MSDAIVAALGALFGGGALVGIVQGWVSHKKGIRDADVERDQTAFEQMKVILLRSEERRVGKECRSRWSPYH